MKLIRSWPSAFKKDIPEIDEKGQSILEKGWPKNMNFSPDGRYIVYDFPQNEDSPESE